MQQRPSQQLWGQSQGPGGRAPPQPPGQVIQITVVAAGGGLTGGGPEMVQLFALLNDGSIWRLQEWRPGEWDQISLPGPVAAANPPRGSLAASPCEALSDPAARIFEQPTSAAAAKALGGLADPAEGRRIVPAEEEVP